VVAIPAANVQQVVAMASDKVQRENGSRAELLAGGYLRDVFRKYGVCKKPVLRGPSCCPNGWTAISGLPKVLLNSEKWCSGY